VASASNDHRLGANEAPPAIISVFLGEQLTDVFDQIKVGSAKTSKSGGTLEIGVDTLPKLPKDAGDRNRTSPFAFTGNRFEFRAVGSGQPISDALTTLNAIVAESIDYLATKLEAGVSGGKSLNAAVQTLLTEVIKQHSAIIFNGNGYTDEWHAEAAKRGLPNLKTTVESLPVLDKPEVVKLFDKYGILTPRELKSRYEIGLEQYIKTIQVEEKLVTHMATATILPAALRYQKELTDGIVSAKTAGLTPSTALANEVSKLVVDLEKSIAALKTAASHSASDVAAEAKHLCTAVLPAMAAVRAAADALEGVVADDLWPLPTYQEMLFIR
jgi:glutamine synthetase